METLTISLDGSSENGVYNIAPLSDAEFANTYTFSISFLNDCGSGYRAESIGSLSFTHRIFKLATNGPSDGKESGASESTITDNSVTMCKATPENDDAPKTTGFVLATNKSTPNGKTYIVEDPEYQAGRNIRSKDKVLGDGKLVLIGIPSRSPTGSSKQHIVYRKRVHACQAASTNRFQA